MEMKKYLVMPEHCRWDEVEATSPEMAYRGICCWFMPRTKICIVDQETGEAAVFTRDIGHDGNLNVVHKIYGGTI